MSKPTHSYHILNPSPWPFVTSLVVFLAVLNLMMFMHPSLFGQLESSIKNSGLYILIPGVAMIFVVLYYWWRDVIKEALSGDHTPIVQLGLRYGMVLFIMSEVMFFASFFWSFFDSAFFSIQNNISFPPANIETVDVFDLPLINTVILLLSSCTLTWAHHSLLVNNRRDLIRGLVITLLLGATFSGIQALEYVHSSFAFAGSNYSGIFYMATGFHGVHVIIGSTFLLICLIRAKKGHFSPSHHFGLEAAAWYWHFVDVVWLFLFIFVYWWGSSL